MKHILTWIWCFPQMLVGLFVKVFAEAKKCELLHLLRGETG